MKEFAFKMGSSLPIIDAIIMVLIGLFFIRVSLLPVEDIIKKAVLNITVILMYVGTLTVILTAFEWFRFIVSTDGAFPIDASYRIIVLIAMLYTLVNFFDAHED